MSSRFCRCPAPCKAGVSEPFSLSVSDYRIETVLEGCLQGQPHAALPPGGAASPGLQRCYSTGSLQQSTHSHTPSQATPCATPPAVRFYSGVIRNGETVPMATLRSATLPQACGYPQACVPMMVKHHSTASLRSHHSAERASITNITNITNMTQASQAATPTSKDASPKRGSPRGQSQYASRNSLAKSEEETCTSPRSARSMRSQSQRSQRSRSFSPKHAEACGARARGRHNTGTREAMLGHMGEVDGQDEEEAPWEVPYAARTGSQSPRAATPQVARSDSQKRRYQNLYEDHEMRKMKWQAKLEEKKRKEEEDLQRSIANTCSPRHFNQEEFQSWFQPYSDLFSS